jgi:5-methyltetrahydropteroyltriglutamate--homocysteine methyltransferase
MTYVTGYPRIGEKRELKFALEQYWRGEIGREELESVAKELRKRHWLAQKDAGIDIISANDFSYYDQMIDMITLLGCEPDEYKDLKGLERYFAMARGDATHKALPMTKWLNTNYHYFVPQLKKDQSFALNPQKILQELDEIKKLGIDPKINLIGPVTFLRFSRSREIDPLDLLDKILPVYGELLELLKREGVKQVQFDEPALVQDPDAKVLEALKKVYTSLPLEGLESFVVTYFEHAIEAAKILAQTPVTGIGLDFVHGPKNVEVVPFVAKGGKKLVAGIVDGRNIWVSDIDEKVLVLRGLPIAEEQLIVSTSCSLLHVPYTLRYEEQMDPNIRSWLAFAEEKLAELRIIDKLYRGAELGTDAKALERNRAVNATRKSSAQIHDTAVQDRLARLTKTHRDMPAKERIRLQHEVLGYPVLPTTTIGSFPQTPEVRRVRKAYKEGRISEEEYKAKIREFIDYAIEVQEDVGLDVFVHGEFERNDMVEYFGELLQGMAISQNGWVQSYGSRCVKPPIIYGDVSRPEPMTVEWITYAQSKTDKIVKGMLTGPVTMLNWSFVRDDLPRELVSKQMALAIADEVADLQNAGIKIIQVDEAAFKEGYPLRSQERKEYERVAVESFRIATAPAKPATQIHTHMCYSDFNDIMEAIDAMDADVISIETARNGNRILEAFKNYHYEKEVGVGVYDIHSPRIPTKEEIMEEIAQRLGVFPASKLWINPDCGLKTRKWEEVIGALRNMVEATKEMRNKIIKF